MPFSLDTFVIDGIEAAPVTVEVDIQPGLPAFNIVGLPDAAVRESRERVRSALKNSGFDFPLKRITVNLAPAYLLKVGPGLDLALAACILAESGQLQAGEPGKYCLCGELALGGAVRPVRGVLVFAMAAQMRGATLAIASGNLVEANHVSGLNCAAVDHLSQLSDLFAGKLAATRKSAAGKPEKGGYKLDLADVRGHWQARRSLEIAAAGGHNLLMRGVPGSGKSMLARRLPSILPPLDGAEALQATAIHSVAGLLADGELIEERPFRAPHHSISVAGLIGGGTLPRPGEITMAHNGVLFLDELAEFPRMALEALRQPLESGSVTVVRANGAASFPSQFTLVAATNPCPCGFAGDGQRPCSCTPVQLGRYNSRLSGPLLDRIDILVDVERPKLGELHGSKAGEGSGAVLERVVAARERQSKRLKGMGLKCNAQMMVRQVRRLCPLDGKSEQILRRAEMRLALGGRGYVRILRVARTVADLEGREQITAGDLSTALAFRELAPVEAVA